MPSRRIAKNNDGDRESMKPRLSVRPDDEVIPSN